ncbi:ABC transporter substrate-binding protein [candidate division KSB1 bacterium]
MRAWFFAIILMFVLFSCSKNTEETFSDEKILYTFTQSDIVTLDPHYIYDRWSAQVAVQIFEGLINYNAESLELEPGLAEQWEYSDDYTRMTFFLHDNVYFHDDPCFPDGKGRKFSAADVKYSYERNYSKKAIGQRFLTNLKGFDIDDLPESQGTLESIRIIDDLTIEFEFKYSCTTFLPSLKRMFGLIVPREAVEYYGDELKFHPVGTGPFKLFKWENNGDIYLRRNDNFREKDASGVQLPYLDGVVYRILKEPVMQMIEFSNGELDIFQVSDETFSAIFKNNRLEFNDFFNELGCKICDSPHFNSTRFLIFKPEKSVSFSLDPNAKHEKTFWKHPKLREALNYAVNRNALVADAIGEWYAFPAKGAFPPGLSAFDPGFKGYYYDPDKAKKLLAEAGFPGGYGLETLKIVIADGIMRSKIGKCLKRDFEAIGVKTEIHQVPYGEKGDYIKRIDAQLDMDGWTTEYPDPINFFEPSAGDVSPEFAQQIFFEADPDKRIKLLREWEKIEGQNCFKIYLYHGKAPLRIVQSNIQNYQITPMYFENLKHVRKN